MGNITPKQITVTAVAGQTKVYGGADPTAFTYTFAPDLIGTDQITGQMGREAGESVANYTYAIGGLTATPNYALSVAETPKFSITPLAVTVTADANQAKCAGLADPEFTFTSEPAVGTTLTNSETISFTGKPGRVAGEDVGTYAINQGLLDNTNYNITFIPTSFT